MKPKILRLQHTKQPHLYYEVITQNRQTYVYNQEGIRVKVDMFKLMDEYFKDNIQIKYKRGKHDMFWFDPIKQRWIKFKEKLLTIGDKEAE